MDNVVSTVSLSLRGHKFNSHGGPITKMPNISTFGTTYSTRDTRIPPNLHHQESYARTNHLVKPSV